jgi:hypothetical protein
LILKYEFGSKTKFFLNGGIFISSLYGSTYGNNFVGSFESGSVPIIPVPFGKLGSDFGAILGIGFNFPLGENYGLRIEARNNFGLADLAPEMSDSPLRSTPTFFYFLGFPLVWVKNRGEIF